MEEPPGQEPPNEVPSNSKCKGKGKNSAQDRPISFRLTPLPGSNPEVDVEAWSADPSLVTHYGVLCKGPQCIEKDEAIRGVRYKCSKCSNVDFCDACMRDPSNSHDRDHQFWACDGPAVFMDWQHMSKKELKDIQAIAGNAPEEYLVVDRQSNTNVEAGGQYEQILDLKQLSTELCGINSQFEEDQLLVHWRNGIPAARTIDLMPGDREEALTCVLSTTKLDQSESYDVVCVAWFPKQTTDGSSGGSMVEMPSFICVGNQYREISKDTADALRAIRSTFEVKRVWVEELCVHRDRAEFAAFQERSVSLIFSKADRTIVWAGNDDSDTETTFAIIEMLSHRCVTEHGVLPSPSDLDRDSDLGDLNFLPIGSDKWIALARFYPLHFFIQGWMLHDVAFATKAVVKCGEYELDWWQVARVRDMLAQPPWMNLDWRQPWHSIVA